jgi:hypothetical protein
MYAGAPQGAMSFASQQIRMAPSPRFGPTPVFMLAHGSAACNAHSHDIAMMLGRL